MVESKYINGLDISVARAIFGECCRPWSKVERIREQNPPGQTSRWVFSPCNDIPDIQDPRVSIRPLALPVCVRVRRFYAVTARAMK